MAIVKATIPSIRVDQEFKQDIENVLKGNETVSSFVKQTVEKEVEYRKVQNDFYARAMASRNEARESGIYYTHEEVIDGLRKMLEDAKAKKAKR